MNIYRLQGLYRKLNNRTLRLFMLQAAKTAGLRTLMVRMDINNYCNLRCIMCPIGANPVRKNNRKEMSPDQFRKLASDIFPRTRSLHLSCGYEPLIVKHFDQCMRIAKNSGIPFVSLATNAMALSETMCAAMIESGIDEIIVSADGAKAKTLESIRAGSKFDKLTANLSLLDEMKRKAKSSKPILRLNFTVMDANVEEIPEFIGVFAPLGMKVLELRPLRENAATRAAGDGPLLTEKSARIYDRMIPDLSKQTASHDVRLIALPSFETSPIGRKVETTPSGDAGGKINPCILPFFTAYIEAEGDLKPCVGGPIVGNILEQSYDEIFYSHRMRIFLKQSRTSNRYCDVCQLKGELVG